jgi:hypothetical protein
MATEHFLTIVLARQIFLKASSARHKLSSNQKAIAVSPKPLRRSSGEPHEPAFSTPARPVTCAPANDLSFATCKVFTNIY